MGDYQHSAEVSAPAGQLFGYLSDVRNLPRYFAAMTSAEPAGDQAVHVAATLDGTTERAEAWFRVDQERQHLEWGSEGVSDYHGHLDVTGDSATSSVTVFVHTERHDSGDIDQGVIDTLAAVKRLVEAGPAPGSGNQAAAAITNRSDFTQ
jgi:hypothetical protein